MFNNIIVFLILTSLLVACQSNHDVPADAKDIQEIQQPNILWLVCEDQSPDFFSFYGDSTITLPNLERLAREGVVFDHMHAPVPVCAPARSAIITGLYPTTLGTHNMRTYSGRKSGNQPSINVPSYSPIFPVGVRPFTQYLMEVGYYCTNNSKGDYNFKPWPDMWHESSRKATWKNRKREQPFFAVFNYNVTHESAIWKNGKKELFVDPDNVKRPPYFPNDSIINHDLAVNYSNLLRMDSLVGKVIQELRDSQLLDQTIIFFYGDHGGPFPRHKRSLYESGTKVPMIIRFPNQKRKGERVEEMLSFIDFAPTILSLAGIPPKAYMQGKAFLGKDENTEMRKYLFTTSDRFDEVYDRRRAVKSKRYKYIRNFHPELPYAIPVSYRMNMPMMNRLIELDQQNLLQGPEKLWMAKKMPAEEFYDLETDPYELKNLALDPAFMDSVDIYRQVLNDWMDRTNDLGGVDEQDLIQRWAKEKK